MGVRLEDFAKFTTEFPIAVSSNGGNMNGGRRSGKTFRAVLEACILLSEGKMILISSEASVFPGVRSSDRHKKDFIDAIEVVMRMFDIQIKRTRNSLSCLPSNGLIEFSNNEYFVRSRIYDHVIHQI